MTTDLRYDLPVAASADRLRAAIADVEGWWTTTVDRDGDEFTARFGVNWTRIHVAGERWTVTGQDTPAIPVPDEWVDDELTFAVEDAGDGTSVLHFAHHGLLAQACADDCRPAWQHFLRSLVALAETGVGTPRRPDAVAAG